MFGIVTNPGYALLVWDIRPTVLRDHNGRGGDLLKALLLPEMYIMFS